MHDLFDLCIQILAFDGRPDKIERIAACRALLNRKFVKEVNLPVDLSGLMYVLRFSNPD
jgi:hypothetical protein